MPFGFGKKKQDETQMSSEMLEVYREIIGGIINQSPDRNLSPAAREQKIQALIPELERYINDQLFYYLPQQKQAQLRSMLLSSRPPTQKQYDAFMVENVPNYEDANVKIVKAYSKEKLANWK